MWRVEAIYEINKCGGWIFFLWRVEFFKIGKRGLHVYQRDESTCFFTNCKWINEQGGSFCLLHEKLQSGWKQNQKNLSEHALLLGTSEQ